jgi:hypothetical protein
VRHLRALSGWVTVAGASICFGILAGLISWGAAAQRQNVWVAAVPRMYADQVAFLAHMRQRYPDFTSDLDLRALTNEVPDPASVLGALAEHVLVQALFFTAVCALMVVLNLGGRPIWAALAPAALIGGVVVSAGPLGYLPGTLGGGLIRTNVSVLSSVSFAAPLWWRLIVAALAALPFAGAWFLTRRPHQRQPTTLGAVALFTLVTEVAVLMSPRTLVPDHTFVSSALPTAGILLVVGCCAAVAGSAGTLRHLRSRRRWPPGWRGARPGSSTRAVTCPSSSAGTRPRIAPSCGWAPAK